MRTRRRKSEAVKSRAGRTKSSTKAIVKNEKTNYTEHGSSANASTLTHRDAYTVRMVSDERVDPPKSPDRPMLQRATSTTASDHHGTPRGPSEESRTRYECEQPPVSFGPWQGNPDDADVLDHHSTMEGSVDPTRQSVALWDASAASLSLTGPGFGLIDPRNNFPEGRVVGVYFDKQRRIWRANWREGGVGKRKTKNFSVDDYGFEEARRLAIEYRLLKIMEASDKQLGGNGMAATEQAALLHAELKRKTEKKESDQKGKRRRRYAMSSNQLAKQSYMPGDFYRPVESSMYHTPWGLVDEQQQIMRNMQQWRNWEGYGLGGGYGFAEGGYVRECVPPPGAPMWMGAPPVPVDDVLDGTAATSPKVVTARPISDGEMEGVQTLHCTSYGGDSSAENDFPSSQEEKDFSVHLPPKDWLSPSRVPPLGLWPT